MQKGQNKFKQQSILGIVTCNREDMLEKLVESIDRDCVEKIFIINNGAALKNNYDGIEVLQSKREFTPVGVGKNRFWREARNINPNAWLFTLEDDITILDNNVFERYISTALDSGICGQLSKVVNFLMANYTRDIKIEEIAILINMNKSSFCRYFKSRTHKTCTQFLNEIRISHACKLLINANMTATQVCYETGYNNISHFSRQFKLITGTSTKEYLRTYFKNADE